MATTRTTPAAPETVADREPAPTPAEPEPPSPWRLYNLYVCARMAAHGVGASFTMGEGTDPDPITEAMLLTAQAIGQAEGAQLRQDADTDLPLLTPLALDTKVWAVVMADSDDEAAEPAADEPPAAEVQP